MTGSESNITALAAVLARCVKTNAAIAITAHVRPDGDAIGSAIGLYHILRAQDVDAQIVGLGPIPKRYQFLCHDASILPPETIQANSFTYLFILDTGALDRAPEFVVQWKAQIKTLNIDHHPTNTQFGDENFIIPQAAAVAEIITLAASKNNWIVPASAAAALWVGLTTDTGRFAYSCTTPATLQAAAELLTAGVDTPAIDQLVFQTTSLAALRLQARAIERMQLHHNNRFAVIALSQQDFHDCEASPEDAEEIINIPRRLDSVEVALLMLEMTNSTPQAPRTKASFRTKPPFDAAAFCHERGGGGHARAAGCEMACSLEHAVNTITQQVETTWFPS